MIKKNIFSQIFSLKNKVVVLTGSAGRLGTRYAHVLSDAGANVVLIDKIENKNKTLEKKIRKKYHTHPLSISLDITIESDVKKLVNLIMKKYHKIDVLINNAHIVPRSDSRKDSPFESYPLDLWEVMVSTNLRGLFLCSREIGRIMKKQQNGNIINISTIYGLVGPDQRIYGKSKLNSPSGYSVFKGGLVNFTRHLAASWAGNNIRVNTLTLGGVYDKKIHTDKQFVKNYSYKTMIGRMANKDDYDGALLFLTSNASSYMTGANLVVDGGWTAW